MTYHPNATRGLLAALLTAEVLRLADRFGVSLDADEGATIAALLVGAVLYVGRRGIRGTLRDLFNGRKPTSEGI